MADLLGPRHLGDVNQSLDTLFKFGKHTIIGDADHAAHSFGTYRISFFHGGPGIGLKLFDAKGHFIGLLVIFQNLNLDFLSNLKQLGWMGDPAPGKISDMAEAVQAAQINENTIVRYIGNSTLDNRPFFQGFTHFFTQFISRFLKNGSTRDNHIIAPAVVF